MQGRLLLDSSNKGKEYARKRKRLLAVYRGPDDGQIS